MSQHTPVPVYSEHSEPEFLYASTPGADLDHGPAPDSADLSVMVRNTGRNLVALIGWTP